MRVTSDDHPLPVHLLALRREEAMDVASAAVVAAMDEAGVTGRELARRLGTSPERVAGILGGTRPMSLAFLADAAGALGGRLRISIEVD